MYMHIDGREENMEQPNTLVTGGTGRAAVDVVRRIAVEAS